MYPTVTAAIKPTVMKLDKRTSHDTERIRRAVKKLKTASKDKRERLVSDLTSVIEVIDRVAKEEVEFLQAMFADDEAPVVDTIVEFEELDDIIVFNDSEAPKKE